MTREEAIEIFEYKIKLMDFGAKCCDCGNDKQAFEMAIELLKQEPYEDCIARQPLIDNWNNCADMLMGQGDSEVVMGWIFDAPPVTPTRKKGKWIDGRCDKCGEKEPLAYCGTQLISLKSKYCPNCGAEMESEK